MTMYFIEISGDSEETILFKGYDYGDGVPVILISKDQIPLIISELKEIYKNYKASVKK